VENRTGTGGGEKLDEQADIESQKNSDSFLTSLAGRELIELWRSGSQDAARVLLARYEVRLVALVASRLNRRLRNGIVPEDVVQSAMGSFFRATSAGAKPTIQLESTASAWNILATFARRKLSRALERETAVKRGGGWNRTPIDQVESAFFLQRHPSASEADEVLEDLHSLLSSDQALLLQMLLEDATQQEIADRFNVDQRTVRRRIAAIRSVITAHMTSDDEPNHPGIVKYLGWGESPHGGPYIISQLIEGQSLAKVDLDDAERAVQWLAQICQAVEAAHQAGVVHGDLTPNNILLADDGRVVVTDFGFATSLNASAEASKHELDRVPIGGTLGFATPEQIASAFGCISRATDIYAIGGIAYYLLTGRGPHDGKEDSLSDTISDEDISVPSVSHTSAESKLASVASLALKKAIHRRPKSASALSALLSD
jgi:RNA polymerase sigma factor (sigma-70 family)